MKLWNWMGGRRNTMVWIAFTVASSCLFITRSGKPIATFGEWATFVVPIIGLLIAGIVTEEKFDKVKAVEIAKIVGVAEVEKTVDVADENKIIS